MTRLSAQTLTLLPPAVTRPGYDRSRVHTGIVHIGVGGFHRSHEAVYTDDLLPDSDMTDWGICGLGLLRRDKAMRDALRGQDCLYSLILRDSVSDDVRVVGSLVKYLYAPDNPKAIDALLAAPETRIVSLTIGEASYAKAATAGISVRTRHSFVGYIVEALDRRRRSGLPPFTVLSCDNLQGNGDAARRAILGYARSRGADLTRWIDLHVAFPNSMVDRITPQTTDSEREYLQNRFDIEDAWPVVAEPFRQWVVEDTFSAGRPAWERSGVQFTTDVHPYETMKIRLLNATHSCVAYLGYLAGFRHVHEVFEDEDFRDLAVRIMDREVTPTLPVVPGIDLGTYKQTLIARFRNARIADQVTRICLDGTAKLKAFVLPIIRDEFARGAFPRYLTLAVAGWMRYLAGVDEQGCEYVIEDRQAEKLKSLARNGGVDPRSLLALRDLFGDLNQAERFAGQLAEDLMSLYRLGARQTVAAALRGDISD